MDNNYEYENRIEGLESPHVSKSREYVRKENVPEKYWS